MFLLGLLGSLMCIRDWLCIGIQLPKGEVRDALNLSANPTVLGKQVVLSGDVMLYCKGPGLKNTKSYKFVD